MMNKRWTQLEALRFLDEQEARSEHGWVLSTDVPPCHQQALEAAADNGLAELAGRDMRAELSAHEGRPVLWAARLTAHGHDVLAYAHASPAPAPHSEPPAAGKQLVRLRPAQMDALRVYISLSPTLRVPPADERVERVCTAYFDRPHNRWRLPLTTAQLESVAYAFHLRALTGSVAEANQFARDYGVAFRRDPAIGRAHGRRHALPSRIALTTGSYRRRA
ncbi:DUF6417 family protein [Streptomyces sp. Ru71]|uniref:DUF6417 family protein n=1 Tax=Streptomyces sp. Ru71 TaxID=2080746 RepID=UPI0015E35772|nr:DUF6417 family protein [Streptomyces sp. Ru71]